MSNILYKAHCRPQGTWALSMHGIEDAGPQHNTTAANGEEQMEILLVISGYTFKTSIFASTFVSLLCLQYPPSILKPGE